MRAMEPITVTTKIDYDQMKRYYAFHRRKNAVGLIFYAVLFVVLFALLLVLNLPNAVEPVMLVFTLVIVFVLLVGYMFQSTGIVYGKRRYARNYGDGDITYNYAFGADAVEFTIVSKGLREQATLEYAALREVCETRDAYYLYQTPGRVFIVDKAGFKNGTVSALSALLKEKLGEEYERFGV